MSARGSGGGLGGFGPACPAAPAPDMLIVLLEEDEADDCESGSGVETWKGELDLKAEKSSKGSGRVLGRGDLMKSGSSDSV
jgi:hypothetical protein